jgi:hypothetical protein
MISANKFPGVDSEFFATFNHHDVFLWQSRRIFRRLLESRILNNFELHKGLPLL